MMTYVVPLAALGLSDLSFLLSAAAPKAFGLFGGSGGEGRSRFQWNSASSIQGELDAERCASGSIE